MTFAEYLRSQGASDEDIKILDTPIARKAHEAMESALAAEKQKMETYQGQVETYYTTTAAKAKELENRAIASAAEAARAKAALMEAQRQGLLDVAKDLGYTPDDPAKKEPPVDPNAPKYLTLDAVTPYLESAGDGLAAVMDAMVEHTRLFPDKPFNARAIRQAAVAAKKPFYQYWEETFKVSDARAAAETARQVAHDKQIADAARAEERAKLASEYANPNTRPAVASNSPFVIRKTADGKPEQPWNRSENELSDARVRKTTENIIKRGEQVTH